MRRPTQSWFWAVQSVSIARVVLTFGFVILAPIPEQRWLAVALYVGAGLTDFIDGRLARATGVVSRIGGALDVFGDRYFSVISCLYVGIRGVSLVPLAVILARELYSVALRMVQVEGQGVMLQNRTLGGVVHTLLALGTVGFIASPTEPPNPVFVWPFYLIAAFYVGYWPYSIIKSRARIKMTIDADLERPS